MASGVEFVRARPRAVLLAGIAFSIAGCSSEVTRFNENPSANPYTSRAGASEVTGPVAAAPAGRIEQAQLPPPGATPPTTVGPAGDGIAGGGRGMSSYQPANTPAADVTGSVQGPRRQAASGQWSWDGGTAVTVAPGETIDKIALRHGVPASVILQANGLTSASAVRPGQRLVIPRYNATASASASAPRPATPMPRATAASSVHIVVPGETLSKISRRYGRSIPDIARANNIEPHATLKIGERIVIPATRTSSTAGKNGQPLANQTPKVPPAAKQSGTEPSPQQASVVAPTNETPAPATGAVKATDATPMFRWPVKGRVIAGFGPKPNGQQNDGINLAVPEDTPIKAAEDGVVAYAGNELKGYGNLVLIRHPNGYVTAYAHAKELTVKRGDPVKRGQVIGKSGQTGNVDTPQLHFEVRKGPTPLDPMPLLSGG